VPPGVGIPKPFLLTSIRTAYDNIITIQVTEGPRTRRKFRIYRGVLCFHSDFYNRALNGAFRESGTHFHEVKNCTIEIFQIFYDWINTGVQGKTLSRGQAIDLFVFADFYVIPALKNVALEAFFQNYVEKWKLSALDLRSAYLKTVGDSPLRNLVSDLVVDTIEFDRATSERLSGRSLPEECFLDMLQRFSLRSHGEDAKARCRLVDLGKDGWRNNMRAHFCERYHDHHEPEHHLVHA
jgi:hypothetical protein